MEKNYANDNTCLVCGSYIPEGRMVCRACNARFGIEEIEPGQPENNTGTELSPKIKKAAGKIPLQKRDGVREKKACILKKRAI